MGCHFGGEGAHLQAKTKAGMARFMVAGVVEWLQVGSRRDGEMPSLKEKAIRMCDGFVQYILFAPTGVGWLLGEIASLEVERGFGL